MQADASQAASLTLRVQADLIAATYASESRVGPPSVLADPDRVAVLLAAIADGNYIDTACRLAGLTKQTYYNLKKRADAGDEAALALFDALEKAEATAQSGLVKTVTKASQAGPQYWAAGMTLLERRWPDKFGKRPDDSTQAKVIVQIGARDSDVTVNVLSPHPDPGESETR